MREQGIDPEHPTRGLGATLDLIALAGFPAGARVLDVSGGMVGPARAMAARSGAHRPHATRA